MTETPSPRRPIEAYRALFPVTREKAWLNNASMGTLSTPVVEALTAYLHEHATGDFTIETGVRRIETARAAAAAFIGADPAEIAFTKNVPDGLNIVAHGLNWRSGDQVVIADQEFPANVYPWLNLQRKGVEVAKVASADGRVPLDSVIAAIDERTRLVSLSWIEFSTGFRNDLAAIASACHERGALFCVDAIQGLGVMPLNVRETGVDVVATSSHKWLLAPTRVGWLYVRQGLIEQIDVAMLGQSSVSRGMSLDYLDFTLPLWPDARRFEPGIHNRLGLVGLVASLGLFNEVGMDRVRDRIKMLTDRAVAGLQARGYEVLSSRIGEEWSGAVCFRSSRFASAEIHRRLLDGGVVISLREPIVRLSPHFYNDESDIERFLEVLPQ